MFDEGKILQGTEKRRAVRDLRRFMTEAREILYKNNGNYFELEDKVDGLKICQCLDIAGYILGQLKQIGRNVKILTIGGEMEQKEGFKDSVDIKQKIFDKEWGKHVAVIDVDTSEVYDPIISEQLIDKNKYFQIVFHKKPSEVKHKISDDIILGEVKYDS